MNYIKYRQNHLTPSAGAYYVLCQEFDIFDWSISHIEALYTIQRILPRDFI